EVEGKLIERGMPELEALSVVLNLPCEVVPFDMDMAILAGAMQQRTRRQGLSLGDRACLALALREGLPVLTADHAWAEVEVGVEIRMLR
uniref:PIN domain-containing protein n=1 Tax=Phenylobacterium aquaticum TaxID=1763816 RepID=UPI0026EC9071